MTRRRRSYSEVVESSRRGESESIEENTEEGSYQSSSEQGSNSDLNSNLNSEVAESAMNTNNVNHQDNPGLMLVSVVLTGKNYLPWRRSMMLAINAKRKSSFIFSDEIPVDKTSEAYLKWKEIDDLVYSWILNALSRDIAETIMYAPTAKGLWEELALRYGQSNGPLVFQLRREICSLTQAGMTLIEFFSKMKRLWDEYIVMKPVNVCACGESSKIAQVLLEEEQLMQFLSGLNTEFDHVRDQILLMNPLPDINKAYSMLITIDRQRSIANVVQNDFVNLSMGNRSQQNRSNNSNNYRGGSRSNNGYGGNSGFNGGNTGFNGGNRGGTNGFYGDKNKEDKFCSHCRKGGHEKEECFRLKGYPEWFRGRRAGPIKHQANLTHEQQMEFNSPLEEFDVHGELSVKQETMQEMIQREVHKALKQKMIQESSSSSSQEFSAFAGACDDSVSRSSSNIEWIIDSGATTHMTYDANSLHNVVRITPKKIFLPTGEAEEVMFKGDKRFTDVLVVPKFKYNLMSVSKLLQDQNISVYFTGSSCVLQGQASADPIALGHLHNGLYYLDTGVTPFDVTS